MARNVRNWWVTGSADGKQTDVSFGPKGITGSFDVTIYQRDKGNVVTPLHIRGETYELGMLRLVVTDDKGEVIHTHNTER